MAQELYSKFGITWYGDESDYEMDRADDQIKDLMSKIIALHDKLHGYVGLRVVMLARDTLKFAYDSEGNRSIVGNDLTIFPGPTPLFSQVGMAPEVFFNPKIRNWLRSQLTQEVLALESKYAAYILALDKLVTDGVTTSPVLSTE